MVRVLLILLLLIPNAYAGRSEQAKQNTMDVECSNSDVDALEDVCTITLDKKYETCSLFFTVATAALTDFDIAVSNRRTNGYITEYSVSGDYTTPTGFLYYTSGDLTTAGTSGIHAFKMDRLLSLDAIRIQAAGTSSNITGIVTCGY